MAGSMLAKGWVVVHRARELVVRVREHRPLFSCCVIEPELPVRHTIIDLKHSVHRPAAEDPLSES